MNKNRILLILSLILISCCAVLGYSLTSNSSQNQTVLGSTTADVTPAASPNTSPSPTPLIGQRIKTTNCQRNGANQDIDCTPGAILPVTKEQICVSGYSASVRNVPESEKKAVYEEYGVISHTTGEYEVDHLISLELGGSNDIANLWPEPASPAPGFHEKDKVENYLHKLVCDGTISLDEAQNKIAHDWLSVYQRIVD